MPVNKKVQSKNKRNSKPVKRTVKNQNTTPNKKNSNKSKQIKNEIKGIFIITIAILILIMTDAKYETGIIGKSINTATLVLFGKGIKILPYFLIIIGLLYILNLLLFNEKKQQFAAFGLFLCYLVDCALTDKVLSILLYDKFTFKDLFQVSLQYGQQYAGGGLIGNILAFILAKLFGILGTFIIISAVVCILIILLTNLSLVNVTKKILYGIKNFFINLGQAIYSFIFVEEKDSESANEKKKKLKSSFNKPKKEKSIVPKNKENISRVKNTKREDIKIYDFSEEQIKIKDTSKVSGKRIVDLKLNDLKSGEKKIKKKEYNEDSNEIPSTNEQKVGISSDLYKLPGTSMLTRPDNSNKATEKKEILEGADKLVQTLSNFNIECKILQINKGPSVTRYELQPAPGIKVSRIVSLTNDIALSLAKSDIRIEAPIPGKPAIGIEVPNSVKSNVVLREIVESTEYDEIKTKIPFAVGKDIAGKNIIANIVDMPHLLVAGATGSGKSVCINSLIMSILFKATPDEVKLILIDPKVVELNIYNGIPHLLVPVVTEPRKAANVLNWAVSEMTNRYKLFANHSVRDIYSYNKKLIQEVNNDRMPQIVIIIDELADLMAVAPGEVEDSITRIAQLARAAGIHLIIATQRPSVDVITGTIKANIPSRIAFAVSSHIDSRTILDTNGAEKLLGKGDMLYYPTGISKPIRMQGSFVSTNEVKKVIDFIKNQNIEQKPNNMSKELDKNPKERKKVDSLLEKAAELVIIEGKASASFLQRKLSVGYARAGRLIDDLEEREIIGGHEGSKPRKVLMTLEEFESLKEN